jgi:hypothetical protein
MSYDLAVFDSQVAPKGRAAFLKWFREQTERDSLHDQNDPAILTPKLAAWFHEMIKTFPPMNGPLRTDDVDNPKMTDYGLNPHYVYACFAWSQAGPAFQATAELSAKHGVGFYEVSVLC